MRPLTLRLLSRVRPAPLASLLGTITGVRRRRVFTDPQGHRFWVDPMSRLGRSLMYEGSYERPMCAALCRYLQAGGMFIDAGANEGYFSVLASRLVGPQGRVYAIEPQSRLGPLIQKNLELNGCTNVTVIHGALGARTGTAEIYLSSGINTGGSSFYRAARYWRPKQSTPLFTLADFLQQWKIEKCDFMKVDVEGAEYDIFMNAGTVLASGRISAIALEIHSEVLRRQGLNPGDLHQYMLDAGYQLNDELGTWVYLHKSARW